MSYEPAELTARVGAGTTLEELSTTLADHRQEVALDASDESATVGGVIASGLSGHRRLRLGPIRDQVLELRFVTGDGRPVKAGGPTVKNVTGYDLPRLLVGSLGTLGVIVDVTLRCRPIPRASQWCSTTRAPDTVRDALYRPSSVLWNGRLTSVLLEGHASDIAAQRAVASLDEADQPRHPAGAHRGRVSVDPARLVGLSARLDQVGVRWLAEAGVGTVHVATDSAEMLGGARAAAHAEGGWMLRVAGAPDLDGWGLDLPARELQGRVRYAFDPDRRMSPGRVPW